MRANLDGRSVRRLSLISYTIPGETKNDLRYSIAVLLVEFEVVSAQVVLHHP